MKKVELLAERAKITNQILKSEYFTIKLKGCLGEPADRVNITEAELKENYENSERLLKKLDAINNILFETDARAYIDVMGNRLSVATARKYLEEFYEDAFLDFRFDDGICASKKDEEVDMGGNLRAAMYRNCIIHELDIVDKDPLNLNDRRKEFRKKIIDWYYALKTAVAVSDATTEVELVY